MSPACESCGAALPETALLRQCGRCAISSTLGSIEDDALFEPPECVGAYELKGVIGRGGMGIVYRARKPGVDRDVALKMILAGAHASFDDVRRFELEAESAATLEHPNIVPVYEVGEHDGLPWFAMRLMDGDSLARRRADFSAPTQAADLVATIARAVRFGHRRGVIHRDLKPDNILFDAHGVPYVADFGVARRLGGATDDRVVAGTPGYLAPEALSGEVTTQADVYALGAILCELLSGKPPARNGPQLPVSVPLDLAAICRKALEPKLDRRYASADALARDLDAFLKREPVSARRLSVPARAMRWMSNHPFGSATAFAAIAAVIIVTGAAVRVAEQQEAELRARALQANIHAAEDLADLVGDKLREHAGLVEQVAERAAADERALERAAAETHFDSWLLLDTRGVVRAREPSIIGRFIGDSLAGRDYVRGAQELGGRGDRRAYVSKAFVSAVDSTRRFAIAAPVFDQERWIGIVSATLTASQSLGHLRTRKGGHQVAVLAAPLEDTPDVIALVHPRLASGEELKLRSRALFELLARDGSSSAMDTAYEDGGARWIAGMARVGKLPLAVIVQTRWEDAAQPSRTLLRRFVASGLIPVAVLMAAAAAIMALVTRRGGHRP